MRSLTLGFLINPLAGTGGPLANKGSDNLSLADYLAGGETLHALRRAEQFLRGLASVSQHLCIKTPKGLMGEQTVLSANLVAETIDFTPGEITSAQDTQQAVAHLLAVGIDLLVFVGGDGTARDVCAVLAQQAVHQAVLGVPAGVKMQSGVYAINPQAAAQLVCLMAQGALLNIRMAEVRDLDEDALRGGLVKSRHFGQMLVPFDGRFVQQVKQSSAATDDLAADDIAAHISRHSNPHCLQIFGPGSTLSAVQQCLGLPASLLGFDVALNGQLLAADADADRLENLVLQHVGPVQIFITPIGGQGHLIGRGNQQLRPTLLRHLGKSAVFPLATHSKLAALTSRCFFMDSGDPALDAQWQGFIPVICGYEDVVLFPLGATASEGIAPGDCR